MDKCWIHDVAKLKRLFLDIIQIWFADCGMSPKKVAYFGSFQDIVEAKEYLQQKGVDVSSSWCGLKSRMMFWISLWQLPDWELRKIFGF